jgi:hypothetical protein
MSNIKYEVYQFKRDMVLTILHIKLWISYLAVLLVWAGIISDDVFDGYIDGIQAECRELKQWERHNGCYGH